MENPINKIYYVMNIISEKYNNTDKQDKEK